MCSSISSRNRSPVPRLVAKLASRERNRLRDFMINPPLWLQRTVRRWPPFVPSPESPPATAYVFPLSADRSAPSDYSLKRPLGPDRPFLLRLQQHGIESPLTHRKQASTNLLDGRAIP